MSHSKTVPTLEDVAKVAGVSTATVSRCLNTPDRVAEKTRQRVTDAVQELGYTPNFGARVMAAKRTFTIGAIIPTMENAIFARGLQAFQEELHDRGYTLLVSSSAYSPAVEKEQIHALVARGADGLLLIGHDRDPAIYDYLDRQNIPTLVAWSFSADLARISVGFDNRASMRTLAQEVVKLGHRNIGLITGIQVGNDRARQRILGIKDAMADAGIGMDALEIVETPYDIDRGGDAFEHLMSQTPRPTVVMCGNDVLGVGALCRARALGIAVPEEVSVTGFDDIELARIVVPPLTTVHVPHREMGRMAARRLVDMVEETPTVGSIELTTSVQFGGSLGPVCNDT